MLTDCYEVKLKPSNIIIQQEINYITALSPSTDYIIVIDTAGMNRPNKCQQSLYYSAVYGPLTDDSAIERL